MKPIKTITSLEVRKEALQKFKSYDCEWKKDYFNILNGGYLVVNKKRIEQSKVSKQEKKKYEREYDMCLTLAQNGYEVEFLKMTEGSFDIFLNGIAADLKKTMGSGNIEKYAKKAIREQGAEIVIFEFVEELEKIHKEILRLKNTGVHGKYYFSKKKRILYEF